jgi:E3 ubiquitin-protein ligase ATL10/75/76/77/78
MILEAGTDPLTPVDLSYESPLAAMSGSTAVILLAFLCAVISLAGFAFVVPWGYIWRSCQNNMAARQANTGMDEKFIQALPSIIYGKPIRHLPGISIATDCTICLAEFVEGEAVTVLPSCNHGFHMGCIGKWLRSHSSCPTCRHCLPFHVCKNMTNHSRCSKPNAPEGQLYQQSASEEYGEILDIECGIKQ